MVSGDSVERQVVNLSPEATSDGIAEWSLPQVVDYLKHKEQEESSDKKEYCRVSYRTSIRLLSDAIAEAAHRYNVSQSRMSKWISFHAISIAQDDVVVGSLVSKHDQLIRVGLQDADADMLDVLHAVVPYSPKHIVEKPGYLRLYDSWVLSGFEELAQACGVWSYRIVQVFMLRSLLTDQLPELGKLAQELEIESSRWDKWMRMRLGAITGMLERNPFAD